MTIKDFNKSIEEDYKDINPSNESWFPLMKYDENYGFSKSLDDVKFLSIGLNPSLTEKFAVHIHRNILGVKKELDFKSTLTLGEERRSAFDQNADVIVPKLVEFQSRLKYDPIEQIPYFNYLTSFFQEIADNISFEKHVFHYDFCQLRLTDSKAINPLISTNSSLFERHLIDIIDIVKPEFIFVFNGWLAKHLRDKDFFSAKQIDDIQGCYFLKGKSNCSPKIVLANQLSGGATSVVYRELMIWNVKRILKGK